MKCPLFFVFYRCYYLFSQLSKFILEIKYTNIMKKTTLNFIIDGLMFICMAAITGIGLLIKYTLLSGQDARIAYGEKVDLFFLGMDRHEWGFIHLIIGYILIGLIVLHVILHWKFITSIFNRIFEGKWMKKAIGVAFIGICTLLVIFPFLIKPSIVKNDEGKGRRQTIDKVRINKNQKNNKNRVTKKDKQRRGRIIIEK